MANPFDVDVEEEEIITEPGQLQKKLKPKWQTMSELLEAYEARPEMFRKQAETIREGALADISALEGAGERESYAAQRVGAGVASDLERGREASVAGRIGSIRAQAAERAMAAEEAADEATREALLESERIADEAASAGLTEITEIQSAAATLIDQYLDSEDGESLYADAWMASKEIIDPEAFRAYWTTVWNTYMDWEGTAWDYQDFESSPLSHPKVQINLQLGKNPFEGVEMKEMMDADALDAAWDKWGSEHASVFAEQAENEEPIAVTPA